MADGNPETSLAGYDFGAHPFEYLFMVLGDPVKKSEGRNDDYPAGSGWASYEWHDGATVVTVETEFYTSEMGERIESVEVVAVSGGPSDHFAGTGRGLQLGDRAARAGALYGSLYVEGAVNGPELGARTITYCFSDETELSVGLDPEGRIAALRLAPSVE